MIVVVRVMRVIVVRFVIFVGEIVRTGVDVLGRATGGVRRDLFVVDQRVLVVERIGRERRIDGDLPTAKFTEKRAEK